MSKLPFAQVNYSREIPAPSLAGLIAAYAFDLIEAACIAVFTVAVVAGCFWVLS